jgi:thiol-disulfide isomerase/thioredoxin
MNSSLHPPSFPSSFRSGQSASTQQRWRAWPVALVLLGLLAAAPGARAQLKVGDALPLLSQFSLEGQVPADLAGRVVVLDFWASWCGPCKASFPTLMSLQTELGAAGLTILGVSVDENKGAYEGFLRKHAPVFPTVRDAEHRLVKVVRAPKMPTTYVVDRRGVVRHIHEGYHGDASAKLLRDQVSVLLAEKP